MSTSVGRCASTSSSIEGECAVPRWVASTFISHGSSLSCTPAAARDGLALVDQGADEVAEVGRRSTSAKCASCGSPVSAATVLTVALKISFDHCAGRRSSNASAFRPELAISSATARASSGVVPRAGPIHVAVSRTY